MSPSMLFSGIDHFQAFDDTQSIHMDDSMSVNDEDDAPTKPSLNLQHGRNTPQPRGGPFSRPHTNIYQGSALPFNEEEHAILAPNWMAEADAERRRQGYNPQHITQFNHNLYASNYAADEYDEEFEQDGDVEEGTSMVENTPSRTRSVPEQKTASKPLQETTKKTTKLEEQAKVPMPKHRKSLSDVAPAATVEPPLRQQTHRFNTRNPYERNGDPESLQKPPITVYAPQPQRAQVQQPPFSSKISSLHESSSEEEQTLPPRISDSPAVGPRRALPAQDLDFDLEALKTKTMTDLDNIPFTIDPRLPTTEPSVDANGQPPTLSSKLINLTKMRSEDQTNLFRSLTDPEREQTAEWFLGKFRSDMQRLMGVRAERRKIALKYEMEVKKRERQVEVKRGDVEEELLGLRKGGAELVRGKSPAK